MKNICTDFRLGDYCDWLAAFVINADGNGKGIAGVLEGFLAAGNEGGFYASDYIMRKGIQELIKAALPQVDTGHAARPDLERFVSTELFCPDSLRRSESRP